MTLSVVIPCFNETVRLGATLDDILAWARARRRAIEIIVVDDMSTDGTPDLVLDRMRTTPELRLVRCEHTAGKGGTVRAGMQAARGARRCFVDADGAFPFEGIEQLEAALDAGADVAVGSRVLAPSLVEAPSLHRRLVGSVFRALVRLLLVRSVGDTQCGFKLFRVEASETLFAQQQVSGFAFDVEVLRRAERAGFRIVEVPVRCHERAGSKVRVLRDGVAMAADVVRLRARWCR